MPNKPKLLFVGEHSLIPSLPSFSLNSIAEVEYIPTHLFLSQTNKYKNTRLLVLCHHTEPLGEVRNVIQTCKTFCIRSSIIVITSDYSMPVTKSLFKSGVDDVFSFLDTENNILNIFKSYLFSPVAKANKVKYIAEKYMIAATLPGMIIAGPLAPLSKDLHCTETISQHVIGEAYHGIDINFFGVFSVKYCGKTLSFPKQAESIFSYICYYYPKSQSADHLAKVFWPDKYDISPSRAKRSLNVELTSIRNTFRSQIGFDEPFLVFDKGYYRLDFKTPVYSDVQEFKRLYSNLNKSYNSDDALSKDNILQQLIRTYQGNFLDNFAEDGFSWIEIERQHLSSLFDQVAEVYIKRFLDEGDFGRAAAMCEELLSRDPRLESVYSCGMICYYQLGRGNKVRVMYEQYCRMMQKEFNSPALPALTNLYQKLISEKIL